MKNYLNIIRKKNRISKFEDFTPSQNGVFCGYIMWGCAISKRVHAGVGGCAIRGSGWARKNEG